MDAKQFGHHWQILVALRRLIDGRLLTDREIELLETPEGRAVGRRIGGKD